MPNGRAAEYRLKAQECLPLAEAAKHYDVKASWRKLAAQWERLARDSIRLVSKHSNLEPQGTAEKLPVSFVPNLDRKLSADRSGERIAGKIGNTAPGFTSRPASMPWTSRPSSSRTKSSPSRVSKN
jgi:hypothetical protein